MTNGRCDGMEEMEVSGEEARSPKMVGEHIAQNAHEEAPSKKRRSKVGRIYITQYQASWR